MGTAVALSRLHLGTDPLAPIPRPVEMATATGQGKQIYFESLESHVLNR
jgi:hypothetical protein